MTTRRNVDLLLYQMKWLADGEDGFPKRFALSMLRNGRRKGWQPTRRQRELMEKLVAEEIFGGANSKVIED